MTTYRRFSLYLSLCVLLVVPVAFFAADLEDAAGRANEAAEALNEIMQAPDDTIPDALMKSAEGIAVIPDMKKGALGIGGTYGKGLVTRRLPNGRWSPPVFIQIGGGSFGLQLGAQETDLVLVFTDAKGVNALLDGKLELGADAGVAAGPVGRRATAGTDIKFESPIYSYSRTAGAFAGVSLEGAVVTIDDSSNEDVYGKQADVDDILGGRVPMHAAVRPFTETVARHTSTSGTSERTQGTTRDSAAAPTDEDAEMDQDTSGQDVAEEPAEELPRTGGNLFSLLIAGALSFAAGLAGMRRR
jgi:lipid-binding SYLF domain-containing protein